MSKISLKPPTKTKKTPMSKKMMGNQYCPKSKDGLGHCQCWWDTGKCCWCGLITDVVAE